MTTKKILIILFIVLALAVAILLYLQAKKSKTVPAITLMKGGGTGTAKPATSNMSVAAADTGQVDDSSDSNATQFPLKRGSRGKAVKMIQAAVGVSITGIWDDATDFAVRNYNGSSQVNVQDFADSVVSNTADQFPVSRGSQGDVVTDIQILVGADPDGKFGPHTEAAVLAVTGKKTIDSAYEYTNLINSVLGLNIGFQGQDNDNSTVDWANNSNGRAPF